MTKAVFERIAGGLAGLAVGDALGVPVEFKTRLELQEYPVRDMIGYGTHNQPPGTWLDDTSLKYLVLNKGYTGLIRTKPA